MSFIVAAIAHSSPPSMISMAGGNPNVMTFPIQSATLTLRNGTTIHIGEELMQQALQYSPTPGLPGLLEWVRGLQDHIHTPPLINKKDHPGVVDMLITNGSQDGIARALEAMVSQKDTVLIETPSYPGTLAVLKPMGCRLLPIQSDKHGMNPDHLQQILSKWKPSHAKDPSSDIPKLLYCIPNGGNPTGHGLTADRKKKIYQLAREYNLLILEDDPYYYLQFSKPRIPSFLSMDEDGRVIRFDSFSKLISSGLRLGFVSGPKPIIERMQLHMQATVMHASGLSQITLLQILQGWGYEGFKQHADKVTEFYRERKNHCVAAAKKHLTGLAEWSEPSGGMFLWLKLNVPDTFKMITVKAREKDVLFVPGNAFMLDDQAPSQYVRAAYSVCTAEQMDLETSLITYQAFERLASLIREEQLNPS
ncbi:hypothetical protein ACJMK2_041529 [Sinanodonta woodiana]|uniref:Kynurenine/alpha-aminoadipate aminotransferase, mitochondrial n=1 Tax=Sinanodonta woodiana TaxID=1069815 RepID=A0ABD3W4G0_SINWO